MYGYVFIKNKITKNTSIIIPRHQKNTCLITSRHQNDIESITVIKAGQKINIALLKQCIVIIPLVVNVNNATFVYKGHGDGDTKWKGWLWNSLLVKFVTLFLNQSI